MSKEDCSPMFGRTVESREIGPLSYQIKKKGNRYSLWRNGCGIGKPDDDGNVLEFKPTTLAEAQAEMRESAIRELSRRIVERYRQLNELEEALAEVKQERVPVRANQSLTAVKIQKGRE